MHDPEGTLKNALNGLYADRVGFVSKESILTYSFGDLELAVTLLRKWEKQGALRILDNFNSADEEDDCIELLSFIP
jgi:hypothetical protein